MQVNKAMFNTIDRQHSTNKTSLLTQLKACSTTYRQDHSRGQALQGHLASSVDHFHRQVTRETIDQLKSCLLAVKKSQVRGVFRKSAMYYAFLNRRQIFSSLKEFNRAVRNQKQSRERVKCMVA